MTLFADVVSGDSVLLLWSDLGPNPDQLQAIVQQIQTTVGGNSKVCVENAERLGMANYSASSFSKIYSGCVGLASIDHDVDTLGMLTKLLKPGGLLAFVQCLAPDQDPSSLSSSVILSGLSSSAAPECLPSLSNFDESLAKLNMSQGQFYLVKATKPNHEVGASRLLSFAKPKPVADVWTLEDIDDDSVELVDDKTLLSEEDLVKPDPSTLRVCGTTGKRKACKDCSCGLAEELDAGGPVKKKDFTSSCGSCYLGDAFRCASCPYLGMPAFNPGDKITLSERQLNPDLRA